LNTTTSLNNLGWLPFFQQQLSLEEWDNVVPARVIEQHKSILEVETENGRQNLGIKPDMPALTVGDWILLDNENQFIRALERKSCFVRKAAGSKVAEQLISANIDTAFIVCSLNEDFNLNRIERYLSIVHEAGSTPVIVLSKHDLCPNPEYYLEQCQNLDSQLCVETVNCLDEKSVAALLPWCDAGKTIVLLGSSGSGKSTLTNTLLGKVVQKTNAIREDDSKGRHTTTSRSLLKMPNDAMIIDTPGMRELQLLDSEAGIAHTFSDIDELAKNCRFHDCQHSNEPGCKVIEALDSGILDQRRFNNYSKLLREQAINSATLAERRADDKKRGNYYKKVISESVKLKRGE
jgi:ribosome biogenesis GTPase